MGWTVYKTPIAMVTGRFKSDKEKVKSIIRSRFPGIVLVDSPRSYVSLLITDEGKTPPKRSIERTIEDTWYITIDELLTFKQRSAMTLWKKLEIPLCTTNIFSKKCEASQGILTKIN